jgi:two-component sensor histidine kinase
MSVDEKAERFMLAWTESDGPAVEEPKRRSFGTRLINRLADQLHGEAHLTYAPEGVIYRLDAPLAGLRAIAG